MKLRNPHVQEGGIANGIIAGGTHIVVILTYTYLLLTKSTEIEVTTPD